MNLVCDYAGSNWEWKPQDSQTTVISCSENTGSGIGEGRTCAGSNEFFAEERILRTDSYLILSARLMVPRSPWIFC